ncbi:septum formation initiator family protein [Myxococcota bacterium]|nr:septum formation initiator family protein [Myxococcota bacterium]
MFRLWPIPVILLSVMAWAFADTDSGLLRWWAYRQSLEESTRTIDALREQVAVLSVQITDLEEDAFATERAIREELGFVRRGEILVRMPGETDSTIAPPLRSGVLPWSDGVAP